MSYPAVRHITEQLYGLEMAEAVVLSMPEEKSRLKQRRKLNQQRVALQEQLKVMIWMIERVKAIEKETGQTKCQKIELRQAEGRI